MTGWILDPRCFGLSVERRCRSHESWAQRPMGPPLVAGRRELDRESRSSPSPLATLPSPGRRERSLGVLKNDAESGSQLAPFAEPFKRGRGNATPHFLTAASESDLRGRCLFCPDSPRVCASASVACAGMAIARRASANVTTSPSRARGTAFALSSRSRGEREAETRLTDDPRFPGP